MGSFYVDSEDQTQALVLVGQVLYSLNHPQALNFKKLFICMLGLPMPQHMCGQAVCAPPSWTQGFPLLQTNCLTTAEQQLSWLQSFRFYWLCLPTDPCATLHPAELGLACFAGKHLELLSHLQFPGLFLYIVDGHLFSEKRGLKCVYTLTRSVTVNMPVMW